MSSPKLFAALFALILMLWAVATLYLEKRTSRIQEEFLRKKEMTARYEALRGLWSEKAQKRAVKQMETLLRIYSVKPKTEKRGGKKIYTFTLDAAKADKVLTKLLNSTLIIEAFSAKRIADDSLEVRVEVAL